MLASASELNGHQIQALLDKPGSRKQKLSFLDIPVSPLQLPGSPF
jgi:hypothetical protein